MYRALSNNIEVQVEPAYVHEQSDPRQGHYFFSYRVRISNQGDKPVQLVRRHWVITDGFGTTEEVQGPGVVGLQPMIKPGEMFEYSSFCPLPTPTGSMQGSYAMIDAEGREMEVEIPLFFLNEPSHFH